MLVREGIGMEVRGWEHLLSIHHQLLGKSVYQWAYNCWWAWAAGACLFGSLVGPDPCSLPHPHLKLLFCIVERSQQGPCSPQGCQRPDGGWGREKERLPCSLSLPHQPSSAVGLSQLSGGWEWRAAGDDPFRSSGP